MNTIARLAVGSIKSHRIRSVIICTAVILTCVLFMTVISITFNIFGSAQLMLMLAGGSDFHALISADTMKLTPDELLDKINADKTVDEAFLAATLGECSDGDTKLQYLYAVSGKDIMPHLFLTLTEGRFPQNSGELALNSELYPDAKPGDRLTLTFNGTAVRDANRVAVYGEGSVREYTVTALFKSDADRDLPALTLYDHNTDASSVSVYLNFHSSLNISGKFDALTESLGVYVKDGEVMHTNVNNAYVSAGTSMLNPANIMFVLFSVAVIFFCAFLLIYNIYSIALTQDMRSYGLLGVIGTTYRQLKSLVRTQTLILYAVSAPVGILAGYFIGWKLLSPVFMSMSGRELNYRFNVWIVIISAALALFSLLYSALRPMKRIRKLTPVEAVSASGAAAVRKEHKPADINPLRLAFYNARRSPGRLVITSLSMALSIILLILVSSFVTLVRDFGSSELSLTDMRIQPTRQTVSGYTITAMIGTDGGVIDDAVYEKIKSLDGIKDLWTLRYVETDLEASEKNIADTAAMLELIPADRHDLFDLSRSEQIVGGSIHTIFLSIPDELCAYLRTGTDEYYSGKELYDGSHVLWVENHNSFYIADADGYLEVKMPSLFADGDTLQSELLKRDYTVIAPESYNVLRKIGSSTTWEYGVELFVMPESVFNAEFAESKIYTLLCNYSGNDEAGFRSEVDKIAGEYNVSGRFDELSDLQNRVYALQLTGYSLCFIIFIIGLMNMVNSALSTVTERRREYAMLEAVGMTGGQMKLMMLTEGFIGSVLSAVISLAVGYPAVNWFMYATTEMNKAADFLPAVIMLVLMAAISAVASLAAFRSVRSAPVIERMRTE